MKLKSRFLLMIVMATGFAFYGCATPAPPVHSRKPSPIYDEQGRPLWVPPPERTVSQTSQTIPSPPDAPAGVSEYPPTEYPTAPSAPKPTPRIGGETAGNAGDGQLIAAVTPLADKARQQMEQGDLDRAFATAERAIRIDSTNPELWHLTAQIQLERGNYAQAEQLAKKSNLLARGNRELQAQNWRIIGESFQQRGEDEAADQAFRKSRELAD
ncbi:hypothetical protein DENIS_2473 [Desulfonema ishimotonii]|uniref:Uncharacterized protein n=1 Tax=Desulfonema ishimotonii TaxID=45657 RepID=A0A401FX24_9BACT|nr:tetratricopeptide repeat protein [Desulfonema ishimotonii]GBC61511.1 hypothetical protein DENIS_2473 [Desulfonema ishimotonii]